MTSEMDVRAAWAAIEDELVPTAGLDVFERCLYYHLLRRSRLAGQRELLVGMDGLARQARMSGPTVRDRLHRLERKGLLKFLRQDYAGTRLEVLLPSEVLPGVVARAERGAVDAETLDFFRDPVGRLAIVRREGGYCFYCGRTTTAETVTLDHAIPRRSGGNNTYRNIVACCFDCNSRKTGKMPADYLRWLHKNGRMSEEQLGERLKALEALGRGELKAEGKRGSRE